MPKIDKLLVKAEKVSMAYGNAHISAFQAAHSLRSQYSIFLEAPASRLSFFALDRNLERPSQLELRPSPSVVMGDDGVFYFGLCVDLMLNGEGVKEFIKLGVIRHGATIRFKCHGQDFESPLHQPPEKLMEYMFETSLKLLDSPTIGKRQVSIGFTNDYVPAEKSPPVAE